MDRRAARWASQRDHARGIDHAGLASERGRSSRGDLHPERFRAAPRTHRAQRAACRSRPRAATESATGLPFRHCISQRKAPLDRFHSGGGVGDPAPRTGAASSRGRRQRLLPHRHRCPAARRDRGKSRRGGLGDPRRHVSSRLASACGIRRERAESHVDSACQSGAAWLPAPGRQAPA